MPPPPRPSYPFVRVLVALVVIMPYMIAVDFHSEWYAKMLVEMVGFGLGHVVELLLARRAADRPPP